MASTLTQAAKLASKATASFSKAAEDLSVANTLLQQAAEDARMRRNSFIEQADAALDEALTAADQIEQNEAVITRLSGLIA